MDDGIKVYNYTRSYQYLIYNIGKNKDKTYREIREMFKDESVTIAFDRVDTNA